MAIGYITQPKDYWIAYNAITITLNARAEPNRTQGSAASGAVIICFVDSIKPESSGGEPGNGDGLWYGVDHNPRRWPLSVSPTYFNSDTKKYVYCAIPRTSKVGTQATIVFPSEQLDVYGKNADGEQVGSADFFYVFLQGVISEPDNNTPSERHWVNTIAYGSLSTQQAANQAISDLESNLAALQGYFTDGAANKALRLADDEPHTAWGRTFWKDGVPVTIPTSDDLTLTDGARLLLGEGVLSWDDVLGVGLWSRGLAALGSVSALGYSAAGGGGDVALGPLLTLLNDEPVPATDGYLHWTGSAFEWVEPGGGGDVPGTVAWNNITGKPATFTPSEHNHDERYYISNGAIHLGDNSITPITSHQSLAAYTPTANYQALTIKGGTTVVGTYAPTQALTFSIVAGSNISVTADATNKKITIANTYSYTHPTGGANKTITAANGLVLSAITVNNLGHVTSVGSKTLGTADIPELDASKITSGTFDVARIPDLSSIYLLKVAGESYPITNSLYIGSVTGRGVFVKDPAGNYVPAIYQNGENLWIGSTQTLATHHRGQTYISAGYDGTHGNKTIYVCVPNESNNGGTNYGVWHSGNDGTGSGLDADLLDGHDSSYFATTSALTTLAGTVSAQGGRITTLEGYFTNGSANSALRLAGTSSYTAWGQTYWQNGVPKSISGAMTNVDSINALAYFYSSRVGVGKSTPSRKLHVYDSNRLLMRLEASNSRYVDLGVDDDGLNIVTGNTTNSVWVNGNVILSSGDIDVEDGVIKIGGGTISWNSDGEYFEFSHTIASLGGVSALGTSGTGGGGTITTQYLRELLDVNIGSSITAGHVLTYRNGYWVPEATQVPSLTDYALKTWVQQQGYLTQHQSLAAYATQTWVEANYVQSLGASGDYVTWNKAGTTNQLTVPFATRASELKHYAAGNTSPDGIAGTFAWSGSGALRSGYDYVGLQIGDAVDKWQLTVIDHLQWRQNDSGGTNASAWGAWRTLIDSANWQSFISMSSLGVTDALAGYLPLTGGTLTGGVYLKSALAADNYATRFGHSIGLTALLSQHSGSDGGQRGGIHFMYGRESQGSSTDTRDRLNSINIACLSEYKSDYYAGSYGLSITAEALTWKGSAVLHAGNFRAGMEYTSWTDFSDFAANVQSSYLPLKAGSDKPLTGNLYFASYGRGVYLMDGAGDIYPGIRDNGTNLWIGAEQTSARHHHGNTIISSGHDGTAGNPTIFVCVPNAANDGGSSYGVWHSGNFTPGNYLPLTGGTLTGSLNIVNGSGLYIKDTGGTNRMAVLMNSQNQFFVGYGMRQAGYEGYFDSGILHFRTTSGEVTMLANGNVGIGTTTPNDYKLDVAGAIRASGSGGYGIVLDNDQAVTLRDSTGAHLRSMFLNSANLLAIGYGTTKTGGYDTQLCGHEIILSTGGGSGTDPIEAARFTADGKLKIGNGYIEWDNVNNMLKFSGGNGIYAMGGVSALGIAGDIDGQVTRAMTFTEAVTMRGTLSLAGTINTDVTIGQYKSGNYYPSRKLYFGDQNHYIFKDNDGDLVVSGSAYFDNSVVIEGGIVSWTNIYSDFDFKAGAGVTFGAGNIDSDGYGRLYAKADGKLYWKATGSSVEKEIKFV